ncbi:MAG TPA: 3D domain-containing protein [Pyrinomonadaceae bacterium]
MTKSLFGGSAAIMTALLTAMTLFYTPPLAAEPALASQAHVQQEKPAQEEKRVAPRPPAPLSETSLETVGADAALAAMPAPPAPAAAVSVITDAMPAPPAPAEEISEATVAAAQAYVATAYSLPGRTATGRPVGKGVIAADTRVLPFGTRVRIDAGQYSGEYVVADIGSRVKGRKIDVWVPTNREACRFGRRNIKLTVLSYGAKKKAKARR